MKRLALSLALALGTIAGVPIVAPIAQVQAGGLPFGWVGLVAFPQPDGSTLWYYAEWVPPGNWLLLYGPWYERPGGG